MDMRRFLMLCGRSFYRLGLAGWIIQMQPGRVRGVLYHAIDSDDTAYNRGLKLSVSPETLDSQLAYFSRYYQFAGSSDTEAAKHSATLAISFDDGFSSVYHNGWPVLKKHKAPASIFLVTRAVQQQLLWFNALNWALHQQPVIARKILGRYIQKPLPKLPRDCVIEVQEHSSPETISKLLEELHEALPFDKSQTHYLSPVQIEEMRAGGISFGFHTVDHYNLINCDAEELARQLDSSALRSFVSDHSFAYPCGYYDADVLRGALSRGFDPLMGVGLDNGRHHHCHLDRVEIYHSNAADIFAQLEVVEPLLALFRRWMRRQTGQRPSFR
ncbi:polysaccharide deacetylase family protein [Granulosicoccus antarcticus]|uniref:NodB homology domain-containing protein n=1 Tax=Granulosicoccus antarcticus IMCC3135 TaxID=1192854 RepID=A0A2Z2NQC1_9GAMM|nr:polysaccharide deacetylase family protein [Granulosicoccus antarcticus]ASJ71000.1 hypothetical protein IMCC3135_04435 [Granulosicoccus antarcticus IMCC3135]